MSKLLYNTGFLYRGSRHFVFFGITVLFFSCISFAQNNNESFGQIFIETFINAIFFFGYAYITIFLLIPEYLLKAKIGWFLLLFLLVGIGLSALKLVVSDNIYYASISPENIEQSGVVSLRFIVVNTKDMTFIVALFCIAKYVKDYLYAENLRRKLERQNKEAQNKLLQSQFDPHFMFNTINNLYALSLLNPLKTNEVISRMKMVLSYIIEESQKDFVLLRDEIKLVENYIELEKLRYGKRLKVAFRIEGEMGDAQIPTMVLFLLVENSFKHGSSLDAGTPWIDLLVKVENGTILLAAKNSKPKSAAAPEFNLEKGKGLKSLNKRLNLIYRSDAYKLDIEDKETRFKVDLRIKEQVEYRQITYR